MQCNANVFVHLHQNVVHPLNPFLFIVEEKTGRHAEKSGQELYTDETLGAKNAFPEAVSSLRNDEAPVTHSTKTATKIHYLWLR